MIFLKQLIMLLSAGIPITQSCLLLATTQPPASPHSRMMYAIYRDLGRGMSFCDSLKRHPMHFDSCTCQLASIGEQTGELEKMLSLAAHYHEASDHFQKQIKQAIFYPAIVTCIALILMLSMLLFIIPQFEKLFHDVSAPLPWMTSAIFHLSFFLRRDLLWIGLALGAGIIGGMMSYRTVGSRQIFWDYLLRFPGLRAILNDIVITRFAHQLAIILSAGLPIHQAFILLQQSTRHARLQQVIGHMSHAIQAGSGLHQAMARHAYFPTLFLQMVRIGEESGKLENTIQHFVSLRESEIAHRLKQLHTLLEPLIMVVLGVLIGGLVIGMYLPLFQLGSAF